MLPSSILVELYCCAGIFKQFMGARNRVEIRLSYRPDRQHSLAWSLDSFLGLLKSIKIRAPYFNYQMLMPSCVCDAARGFEGDGRTCAPAAPCWANPVVCDPNAGLANSFLFFVKLLYSLSILLGLFRCIVSYKLCIFFQSVCHLVVRVMDAGTKNLINSMRLWIFIIYGKNGIKCILS
jgi:hypothetical protein